MALRVGVREVLGLTVREGVRDALDVTLLVRLPDLDLGTEAVREALEHTVPLKEAVKHAEELGQAVIVAEIV